MDQDQLNPYVAYEGYVVRVPHNPPQFKRENYLNLFNCALLLSLSNTFLTLAIVRSSPLRMIT